MGVLETLSADEREIVRTVRDFVDREIKPVVHPLRLPGRAG